MDAILLQNMVGTGWCETNILQNLKGKCGGTWHIISPLSEEVRGCVFPVSTTKLRPWMSLKKTSINQTVVEKTHKKNNDGSMQIGILILQKQYQLSKLTQLSVASIVFIAHHTSANKTSHCH